MKNFKTKLLGVLVLGAISCISTVSAANITIGQRNSYGVLNLTKLILKSGTNQNTTGIVFDGEGKEIRFLTSTGNLTLKLVGNNVTNSAIRVSKVCDTNGENCKNISDLVSTGNTNNITINTGNGTNIRCTYENGEFNCDNTAPNGGVTVQTGRNGFLCKYNGGQLVCNVDPSQYIGGTGTNGKLCKYTTVNGQKMISCDISLATGTNNNIRCTYQNNQLKCNNANPTTNITGQSGSLCKLSGNNALVCDQSIQTITNNVINNVTNTINTDYITNHLDTDYIINTMVSTGSSGGYCKRVCKPNGTLANGKTAYICRLDCTDTANGGGYWKLTNNLLYPTSTANKVAIGTSSNPNGYTLNVAGSGKFLGKLSLSDVLTIKSNAVGYVYSFGRCNNTQETWTSPAVNYSGTLRFRDSDELQCSNGYIEFGDNGRMGIGGSPKDNEKLAVMGHTRIYHPNSSVDAFIDLYNDGSLSHIESMYTNLYVGLTGYFDGWGAPSYIRFKYGSIGINKNPNSNSHGHTGYPTLQINGGIQVTNNSVPSTTNCDSARAGMIQFYNKKFYGCDGTHWIEFTGTILGGTTQGQTVGAEK